MKQFIVLAVTLPLMLFLFAEFALNESNSQKIYFANQYVYSAKEIAKQSGYFDDDNIEELKKNIAALNGIDASEVVVAADGEDNIKYRNYEGDREGRYIYYDVYFPLCESISLLRRDGQTYYCHIKGYTPSEYVGESE